MSSDASLLAVELPLVLDGSGGGGGDDLVEGRIVMDLQGGDVVFAVDSAGGRLGSCRFDGDLKYKQVSMRK